MRDFTKLPLNWTQKVLTKAELKKLPALYSQDGKGENAMALVHFFQGGYDFWASEFDPQEGTFFGVARLYEREMGYVSVDELMSTHRMERDLYWTPKPLKDCK